MNIFKKFICTAAICAIVAPYAVYAEAPAVKEGGASIVISDGIHTSYTSDGGYTLQSAGANMPAPDERKFIDYVVNQIATEHSKSFEIPSAVSITHEAFQQNSDAILTYIASCIQEDHPEVFYISNRFSLRYQAAARTHMITSVTIADETYSMTDEEIEAAQTVIDSELKSITDVAKTLPDDLRKALYVHDYIMSNYSYDTRVYDGKGEENRDLYTMIRDKTAVCQGYTYLFMACMKELSIECITVPTDRLNHIWNKVKINGSWYNVDVTYDDPIANISPYMMHRYFLVTDEEITALDPSRIDGDFYMIEDRAASELAGCYGVMDYENDTVTIKNADDAVVVEAANIDHETSYSLGDDTPYTGLFDSNGNLVAIYNGKEKSCHTAWNKHTWDGKSVQTASDTSFSYSPLHDIKGATAYLNGSFYGFCYDNHISEIIFSDGGQAVTTKYDKSADYRWYPFGEPRTRYYTSPTTYDRNYPFYSDNIVALGGKLFFNSPDAVYELKTDPYNYGVWDAEKVYDYEAANSTGADPSKTYFWGLRAENNTLYAEYTEDNGSNVTLIEIPVAEYTVTFDAGEHGAAPDAQKIKGGYSLSVEEAVPADIEAGWEFDGWYTAAEGGDKVTVIASVKEDMTLFAHYSQIEYIIAFNTNGGSELEDAAKHYGDVIDTLPVPEMEGYDFDGWYTAAEGGDKVTAPYTVTGSAELFARWTIKEYSITWVVEDASTSTTAQHGSVPSYGESEPEKEADSEFRYVFIGWSDGKSDVSYTAEHIPAASDDATYTAVFARIALTAEEEDLAVLPSFTDAITLNKVEAEDNITVLSLSAKEEQPLPELAGYMAVYDGVILKGIKPVYFSKSGTAAVSVTGDDYKLLIWSIDFEPIIKALTNKSEPSPENNNE